MVGRAELKPGEWVLVTASAGGVGIAAVQLAKGAPPSPRELFCIEALTARSAALGAKVIAAAGSQEKIDISIRYGGADHGVLYTKDGWQKEVLKLTGGKGVDVIYDPVGLIRGASACRSRFLLPGLTPRCGRRLAEVHSLERPRARRGLCSGTDREGPFRLTRRKPSSSLTHTHALFLQLALNLVLLKNISIVGIHWGAYTSAHPLLPPLFPAAHAHPTRPRRPNTENEPQRVPVVWKELLACALSPTTLRTPC